MQARTFKDTYTPGTQYGPTGALLNKQAAALNSLISEQPERFVTKTSGIISSENYPAPMQVITGVVVDASESNCGTYEPAGGFYTVIDPCRAAGRYTVNARWFEWSNDQWQTSTNSLPMDASGFWEPAQTDASHQNVTPPDAEANNNNTFGCGHIPQFRKGDTVDAYWDAQRGVLIPIAGVFQDQPMSEWVSDTKEPLDGGAKTPENVGRRTIDFTHTDYLNNPGALLGGAIEVYVEVEDTRNPYYGDLSSSYACVGKLTFALSSIEFSYDRTTWQYAQQSTTCVFAPNNNSKVRLRAINGTRYPARISTKRLRLYGLGRRGTYTEDVETELNISDRCTNQLDCGAPERASGQSNPSTNLTSNWRIKNQTEGRFKDSPIFTMQDNGQVNISYLDPDDIWTIGCDVDVTLQFLGDRSVSCCEVVCDVECNPDGTVLSVFYSDVCSPIPSWWTSIEWTNFTNSCRCADEKNCDYVPTPGGGPPKVEPWDSSSMSVSLSSADYSPSSQSLSSLGYSPSSEGYSPSSQSLSSEGYSPSSVSSESSLSLSSLGYSSLGYTSSSSLSGISSTMSVSSQSLSSEGYSPSSEGYSPSSQSLSSEGYSPSSEGYTSSSQSLSSLGYSSEGYSPSSLGYSSLGYTSSSSLSGISSTMSVSSMSSLGYSPSSQSLSSEGYSPSSLGYSSISSTSSMSTSMGYSPSSQSESSLGYSVSSLGYSPSSLGYSSEGYSPSSLGYSVSSLGYSPSSEGYSPSSQSLSSEGYSPSSLGYSVSSEGYSPSSEGYSPSSQSLSSEGYSPSSQSLSSEGYSPSSQSLSSEGYSSSSQSLSSQGYSSSSQSLLEETCGVCSGFTIPSVLRITLPSMTNVLDCGACDTTMPGQYDLPYVGGCSYALSADGPPGYDMNAWLYGYTNTSDCADDFAYVIEFYLNKRSNEDGCQQWNGVNWINSQNRWCIGSNVQWDCMTLDVTLTHFEYDWGEGTSPSAVPVGCDGTGTTVRIQSL